MGFSLNPVKIVRRVGRELGRAVDNVGDVLEDAGKFAGDALTGGAISAAAARKDARRQANALREEREQQQQKATSRRRNLLRAGLRSSGGSNSLFDVLGSPQ